jgi:hypothetical protein
MSLLNSNHVRLFSAAGMQLNSFKNEARQCSNNAMDSLSKSELKNQFRRRRPTRSILRKRPHSQETTSNMPSTSRLINGHPWPQVII